MKIFKHRGDIYISKSDYTKNIRIMTLSLFLPTELKNEDLNDSYYKIVRRSGFVSSTKFSEEFVKKDDVYVFMVGSTFTKSSKELLSGQILDVSNNKGSHKVYKHLVPLFLGVGNEWYNDKI